MENTYLAALHGMEELMPQWAPMETFKKKVYEDYFQRYYESKISVYDSYETGYQSAIDKEQYVLNMAEAAVKSSVQRMEGIKRKNRRESLMIDLNMNMVIYVLPGLLHYQGEGCRVLVEAILREWKKQFPQTNISAAPHEEIVAGFHKKWCYITTAVCEVFGKPDDCYELTLLRSYRDNYLLKQPDGEKLVREYYDVAPTIVKHINRLPDKRKIYQGVWQTYLQPCISMIENGQNEECKELYMEMVRALQEKYFIK